MFCAPKSPVFTCDDKRKSLIDKAFFVRFSGGGVPEWLKGTGCKPVGYAYVGSNPTPSTIVWAGVWSSVYVEIDKRRPILGNALECL
jgi:hypothetical protein